MIKSATLIHLALPFVVGFLVYLLPKGYRLICVGVLSVSLSFPLYLILNDSSVFLTLKNNFGVTLYLDATTGYFLLTNSLVTLATLIYCWQEGRSVFFYSQLMILFASVNGAFLSYDFITFYVAIEVLSIAAFLLITYNRNSHSIWIGLRYLFVSNVSMLFYLIGAVLVYKANHSFSFQGLANSPRSYCPNSTGINSKRRRICLRLVVTPHPCLRRNTPIRITFWNCSQGGSLPTYSSR